MSLAVPVAAAALLAASIGTPGVILALLASVPWLGWRFNDEDGTVLILSLFLLVILLIPIGLIAFMALLPH